MKITIAMDVSGSVGDSQFKEMQDRMYARYVGQVGNQYTVILFDNRIVATMILDHIGQIREIPLMGRGGANEALLLNAIAATEPDETVICTDDVYSWSGLEHTYEKVIFN